MNLRTATAYDRVVCTTAWAAQEFTRIGVGVDRVALGVDRETFHPARHDPATRSGYAGPGDVLVVCGSRLSPEKQPQRAIEAVLELRRDGVPAVLVMAGDGPVLRALRRRARGLPVHFVGFVEDRVRLATLFASADVVIAPGPAETFGLAAVEALASGTPVVVSGRSALPEVVGDAGVAVPDGDFAAAVRTVLGRDERDRRHAARARAEGFGWPAAVAGFLAAHGLPPHAAAPAGRPAVGPLA